MGSCVSRPEGCVGGRRHLPADGKRRHRRRRVIRRRVKSMETIQEVEVEGTPGDGLDRICYTSPTLQGNIEETWFDSITAIESDCDDDFQSVNEDEFSFSGLEEAAPGFPPSKESYHGDGNFNCMVPYLGHHQKSQISGESFVGNSDHSSKVQPGVPVNSLKSFVSHSDVSSLSADQAAHRDGEEGILDNCGILHNNCLPFLVTTIPTTEKKKSLSSSPPNSAKKASLKLSFKRKSVDGHPPASAYDDPNFSKLWKNCSMTLPCADFSIQDGFLFNGNQLCIISTSLREKLIQELQDKGLATHTGRDKTLALLQARFYWPRLRRDVT